MGNDGNEIYVPPRKRLEANREQEIIRRKWDAVKRSTASSSDPKPPPYGATPAVDMSSSYYGVEAQFVRSTATINKMRNPAAMGNTAMIHNPSRTSRPMSVNQREGLPYDSHCTYCQMLGLPEKIYKSHDLLRDDRKGVNCNRYIGKGCGLCSEGEYVQHHIEIHCNKWQNTYDPGFDEFARNFNIEKWEADQSRKTGGKKRESVPVAPSARPVIIIKNSKLPQDTWRGRAAPSLKK